MTDKGLLTFFFGRRHKVTKMHSPFQYVAKTKHEPENKTGDVSAKTNVAFVRQCDYHTIFDKDNMKCIARNSEKGREISMKRLNKYKKKQLEGENIKGLLQFKDNCWFNSLLMCLFFSDGGRKIMNSLRKEWIQSQVSSRQSIYNVFTYLMEIPHYNKDIVNRIDSNMILAMLHSYDATIFEHPGYEGGSGILYCSKLLSFLGLKNDYLEMRFIETNKGVYTEVNGVAKQYIHNSKVGGYIRNTHDTMKEPAIMAVFLHIDTPFLLPKKIGNMLLDSVYLSNYNRNIYQHAIAGITCNKKQYVYDGERALSVENDTLKKFDWASLGHKSFAMTYDKDKIVRYNFAKSVRVAFYVRKDNKK